MSSLAEFLGALDSLKTGVKEFATSRAIQDSTNQLHQLKETVKDEGELRIAQQSLSNDLAARLTGIGANPNQVAQSMQIFGPRQYGSVAELATEGALSNNSSLLGQAAKAQDVIGAPAERQFQQQQATIRRGQDLDYGAKQAALQNEKNKALADLNKDQRERYINGLGLAPDMQTAKDLRTKFADVQDATQILSEIEDMSSDASAAVNPKVKERIQQRITVLTGKLRIPLTGPGVLTEAEKEDIRKTIGDPSKLLTSAFWVNPAGGGKDIELQKIRDLRTILNRSKENAVSVYNLQPLAPGDGKVFDRSTSNVRTPITDPAQIPAAMAHFDKLLSVPNISPEDKNFLLEMKRKTATLKGK